MRILSYPYSLWQKIKEIALRQKASCGLVLMFHQVNDDRSTWVDPSCSITQKSFAALITKLQDKGYCFKPLAECLTAPIRNSKVVYITFDDAYRDVYANCFPLLKRCNIPFTIFLATDFLGKAPYLTFEMVEKMYQSGLCTVGSHTKTHSLLRFMSHTQVLQEMQESKAELEALFGCAVEILAYPYGSVYACSNQNTKAARAAGYTMSFSTMNAPLPLSGSNRHFLPRLNINEDNHQKVL